MDILSRDRPTHRFNAPDDYQREGYRHGDAHLWIDVIIILIFLISLSLLFATAVH